GSGASALDRLDARDAAQGSVELAPARDGVEVRPAPDRPVLQPADQVADAVGLDPEPGLLHPAGGELVCLLLAGASPHAISPDPFADGVELVEPLEHAHVPIIPLWASGRQRRQW